jgi:FSR family fosmidomycin resistance protein-like MFS transporter
MHALLRRRLRQGALFMGVILLIELLDEIVYGAREAAWPLIRDDLGLNYVQIGLLIGIPGLLASFIEPFIGIFGDIGYRRRLILGGGLSFALSLLLTGVSADFGLLLASFILFYPSSGAFVNLAQAALMDHQPDRHEHNMARWTLAGSLGVVLGPLALGAAVMVGAGWRGLFLGFGLLSLLAVVAAWRLHITEAQGDAESPGSLRDGLVGAWNALRRGPVLRWLVLLQFADLMMDVLLGYLALYFVDVAQVSEAEAGIAVAVWTGIGLIGDILLIPLLERVRGLTYLRLSAWINLLLFPAFLLAEPLPLKLVLLALLGFFNAGWYSVLQGNLYSAMPGQSGTVMTVGSVTGLIGSVIPLLVGVLAEQFGLGMAMWALLLGPIVLVIGLPRRYEER